MECVDLTLETGRVEKLNVELLVLRAVVRGKAIVEAAPNHRVANVRPGGFLHLEDVEVRNGFDGYIGGGCVLVNRNATLRAKDVVFTNCTTSGFGGAILAWTSSTITLTGKSIVRISTATHGGALYAFDLTAIDLGAEVAIFACTATQAGGAVFLSQSSHFDLYATITSCYAGLYGGGVVGVSTVVTPATMHVQPGSRITQCSAGVYGGAFFGYNFHLIVDGAAILDCVSGYGGVGLFFEGSRVLIKGGTEVGRNTAYVTGGAFLNWAGTATFIEEQSVIHNCTTLYGGALPPNGGAFLMWSQSALAITDGAEIRDCAATSGGAIYALTQSLIRMERGALIRNCHASTSGGGIYGSGAATIEMWDAPTGIQNCVAGMHGGGIACESGVDFIMSGHVTGNIAIIGSGGGLHLLTETRFHAFSGAEICDNTAAESGGGLLSSGLLALGGNIKIARNIARGSGGGAYMKGEDALLVQAAEGHGLVEVIVDATRGTRDGYLLVKEAHHSRGVRPSDATGASSVMHIELGKIITRIFCLARGTSYELLLVSPSSEGWTGTRASYRLLSEIGTPSTEELFVETGHHAASYYFDFPGSSVRGQAPLFIDNRAFVNGGGIALSERASVYGALVTFTLNSAAQLGGGAYVDTLCRFDAVGFEFLKQTASYGGGVYTSILSTVYLNDTLAIGNVAVRDGGFAVFDTAKYVIIKNLTAISNSVSERGGAISSFRVQSSVVSHSTFIGNQAGTYGAAIMAQNTEMTILASKFNEQFGRGDGTIASLDSNIDFERETCIPVDFVLDFTQSNTTCQVIDLTRTDVTCDFYPQGCTYFMSGIEGDISCDGCSCHQTGERYAAVIDAHGEEVARLFFSASAIRTEILCLTPSSKYQLQGFDLLGEGWLGGTVQAFISDRAVTPALSVDKFESTQATFTTPELRYTVTGGNQIDGGGGFIFWTVSEPANLFENVVVEDDSVAGYGRFVASAPVAMTLAESNGTYFAASGETIASIVVELIDNYGTIVTVARGETAIIQLSGNGGFISNNLAQFSPRAVFTSVAIFDKPGAVVPAIVSSETLTLESPFVGVAFILRSCATNEYETLSNASGYSVCAVCADEEYLDTKGACVSCSRGMSCENSGNELSTLLIKAGWYRTAQTSNQVYACTRKNACPESIIVGPESCAEGHVGILCATCASGWYKKVNGRCVKCKSKDRTLALVVYSALTILFVIGICWLICSRAASNLMERVSEARFLGSGNLKKKQESSLTPPRDSRQRPSSGVLSQVHSGNAVNRSNRTLMKGDSSRVDERHKNLFSLFVVKLKAILTFVQIMATLPTISLFTIPEAGFAWLALIGSFVNVSLQELLPWQCLYRASTETLFVRSYVGITAFPIALALFLVAGYSVRTFLTLHTIGRTPEEERGRRRTSRVCTECMLLVIHLTLPAVSTSTFLALVCLKYDFGEDQIAQSYMRVAPTISCSSASFKKFIVPWSLSCIFIYPIGVPTLYMTMLWRQRTILNPKHTYCEDTNMSALLGGAASKKWMRQSSNYQRKLGRLRMDFVAEVDEHHAVRAYQFLWIDYRCEYYYFEVVDIGRRILLTACLAIITPGRPLQLVIGFIMSTVFTIFIANSRPFEQSDDNLVSIVTQLCTTCSFFTFLLLRVSVIAPKISNVIVIIFAITPLFFIVYALRWFCPCFWTPKTQVVDEANENGRESFPPTTNIGKESAIEKWQQSNDYSDDGSCEDECASPKSDVCLMVDETLASDAQIEETPRLSIQNCNMGAENEAPSAM